MAQNKTARKYSLDAYTKIKEARDKQRFHFTWYPAPILAALLTPIVFFLILVVTYFLYMRNTSN